VLAVLGCEIDQRPPAPGIDDLAEHIRGVTRGSGHIAVTFGPEALAQVEAFAAAERQCCAGIGWDVSSGDPVVLRISADAASLSAMERMFSDLDIERTQ
jgi:hypothetical protein